MPFLVIFAVASVIIIVGTIIGVATRKAHNKPLELKIILSYSAVVAVTASFCMGILLMAYTDTVATYRVSRTMELASMRDANTQTGSFIIGTGSTSSELLLNFYTINNDGGMQSDSVPGYKATIYEVAEGPYRIEVLDAECTDSILCFGFTARTKYEFYVPKGSVLTDFKLDTE